MLGNRLDSIEGSEKSEDMVSVSKEPIIVWGEMTRTQNIIFCGSHSHVWEVWRLAFDVEWVRWHGKVRSSLRSYWAWGQTPAVAAAIVRPFEPYHPHLKRMIISPVPQCNVWCMSCDYHIHLTFKWMSIIITFLKAKI